MDHADVADDVCHQHRGYVLALVLVDIAHGTSDAGVVDQDVEMPLCPLNDFGRTPNRIVRGHLQLDELSAGRLGDRTTTLRVTRTEIHAMPRTNKPTYRLKADPLIGSRDQAHPAISKRRRHHCCLARAGSGVHASPICWAMRAESQKTYSSTR